MTHGVTLTERHWEKRGHGGLSQQVDYEIYLNDVRLRGYSTHGNMEEGYWGSSAKKKAEEYARAVADTLGVTIVSARVKLKETKKV